MFLRSKPCFPFVFTSNFCIFVISPDYDTVITKSFFVLMLDSEGYFLTIDIVGRSCPHSIENDSIARFLLHDMPISCVCKRVAGTILSS